MLHRSWYTDPALCLSIQRFSGMSSAPSNFEIDWLFLIRRHSVRLTNPNAGRYYLPGYGELHVHCSNASAGEV